VPAWLATDGRSIAPCSPKQAQASARTKRVTGQGAANARNEIMEINPLHGM